MLPITSDLSVKGESIEEDSLGVLVVVCFFFFLFFLSILVIYRLNIDLSSGNLPHIKVKRTHYNNPYAPRLVKNITRENLYKIKIKEIIYKSKKNSLSN